MVDEKTGWRFDALIVCRRLGEDNGKDQLVNISNYLKRIRDFVLSVSRKLTPEEKLRLRTIFQRATPTEEEKKRKAESCREVNYDSRGARAHAASRCTDIAACALLFPIADSSRYG
jgi:hypothetical protein